VQSTAEAAVLLGSDMLRALILGTEMFSSFRQDLGDDRRPGRPLGSLSARRRAGAG